MKNLQEELGPSNSDQNAVELQINNNDINIPKSPQRESDSNLSSTANSQRSINHVDQDKRIKKKKIKINPWKLAFILVIVGIFFILLILEQTVPPFEEAFENLNMIITSFLKDNPLISFFIWIVVLIGKSFGVKDFLELKRASLISFIAVLFSHGGSEYAAVIALIAHALTAVMDTIAAVFEFKFIGVEAQSVNNTFLEWAVIVGWFLIWAIFVFPFQWIFSKCCNKLLCPKVRPLKRQRSHLFHDPQNRDNDNDNSNDADHENDDDNTCISNFIDYMTYDNSAFKLVGKTNLESEYNVIQFLSLSPYKWINNSCFIYPFAIIMLIFNGLSMFADAVFFLFQWRFGKKSLGIIAGYNFFDIESYIKTYLFTETFLFSAGGLKAAVLINSLINGVGKVVGIFFTYLINVVICKPIIKANPQLFDRTKTINFSIGYASGDDDSIGNAGIGNPEHFTKNISDTASTQIDDHPVRKP